jgi:hypothetical protein
MCYWLQDSQISQFGEVLRHASIMIFKLLSMELFLLRMIQLLLFKSRMRYTFRSHVTERFVHGE